MTNTTVTQIDCPLERASVVKIICLPLCECVGKICHRGAASVRHGSSRNHSFSSDKDLAVGSSHDEWGVEITSPLQG